MRDVTCVCKPVESVVAINGVPIHALTPRSALARVQAMLKCPAAHVVNHIPADPVVIAGRDPVFRAALQRADLNLPDGMGVLWALRVLGIRDLRERVYGPDFMLTVMDWGNKMGVRHALLGSSPSTIDLLIRQLKIKVQKLEIVAAHSPPIRSITPEGVDDDLAKIGGGADMIWVGLGTPKQQIWADLARQMRAPRIIFTVGAAFDFLAGTKPQAPNWVQRSGLEWLFRLVHEPKRLWRRYLLGNPRFIWAVAAELARRRA